ncbi:hypothetical protein EVAR_94496_1 [Eumeta japonica]|uniref:Uncharacterized protein n=1 Tax=Eumeta variegata TaxID=151549 RepID=A0A4C1UUS1_EUMVA|nr:hypothetical protein EVAR_94496_1 [Eumeta japonica]
MSKEFVNDVFQGLELLLSESPNRFSCNDTTRCLQAFELRASPTCAGTAHIFKGAVEAALKAYPTKSYFNV